MNRTIRKITPPAPTRKRATKFSDAEIICKNQLRLLRLSRKNRLIDGADVLGITQKQLEALESTRGWGSHVQWDHICAAVKAYNVSADIFLTASLK